MLHHKRFGRYEIQQKLGRSITDVYLAIDTDTGRRVALKIIEESHDPATQLALEAERRGVLIQKQLHEVDSRVLEVYDYGESNGYFFVAMEFVEGKSIAEIVRNEKRLEPVRAARYACEVCSQLDRLHSFSTEIDGRKRAIVHGDIKPSNLQIGPNGQVRLLDFGIAKAITFTHNVTHHNMGSPSYCSPERLTKGQVDPHVDLWALGVTLYEMVTGLPPYQAQTTRKLETLIQSRRPPRALPAGCPPALRAIIAKSLAANVERRYATALALGSDLTAFLEGRITKAETEREPVWNGNETIDTSQKLSAQGQKRFAVGDLRLWFALKNVDFLPLRFVLLSLTAGVLIGLLLLVPGIQAIRFWIESGSIRHFKDYSHRSVEEVAADWKLYRSLERGANFYTPMDSIRVPFRTNLIAAADDVIERYANSSNPSIAAFDWRKAHLCLTHALDLEKGDHSVRGKLALCSAYLYLLQEPPAAKMAKAGFEEAASYLPRSPDPHLGLARINIYILRNIGGGVAELHQAERMGFKLGPREMEQQADGYLARAQSELVQAERFSRMSAAQEERYLSMARRDLERATTLYEPIDGFSNVNSSLQRLYLGRSKEEQLRASYELAARQRRRRWR